MGDESRVPQLPIIHVAETGVAVEAGGERAIGAMYGTFDVETNRTDIPTTVVLHGDIDAIVGVIE